MSICIKYQGENNNISGVDNSELTIRGVKNLVLLELETRSQTEAFRSHIETSYSTSMHSSRIRTARLLSVSPSMHCEVGCLLPELEVCIPACTEADTPL